MQVKSRMSLARAKVALSILFRMGTNEFSQFTFVSQECPSGVVNEENFKTIYSQFFPQGGELSTHTTKPEELHLCPYFFHSFYLHAFHTFLVKV